MSHEVESMMYVGATPWHGLGTELENEPTIEQALEASGLNWTVTLHDLFACVQTPDGMINRKSDHRLVVRDTDHSVLGTVGPRYTALQNRDAFAWFSPWLEQGAATLETAGALREGSRVWILARLNGGEQERISADDRVSRYILLGHGHDGTLAVRAGLTAVRVVCNNTLSLATSANDGGLVKLHHTKNLETSLRCVRDAVDAAHAQADVVADRWRAMRKIEVRKRSQVADYLAAVFGPAEAKRQKEAHANRKRTPLEDTIETLMLHGRGTDLPGVKGTAWGLYNAVSEYLTHVHGRGDDARAKAEKRADRNAWGAGAQVLSRAQSDAVLDVLLQRRDAEHVAAGGGVALEAAGF